MNIHERIRRIRTECHLTILELSKILDIPDRTISNYERGERKPSVDYLSLLAEKLDANPVWLMLERGEIFIDKTVVKPEGKLPDDLTPNDFIFIPMYDLKAAAGSGSIVDNEKVKDFIAFTRDWLFKNVTAPLNQLIMIHTKGDSMSPTINDGDMLLVDKSDTDLKNDGIYVLRMGNSLIVKRIQHLPENKAEIISDNHLYKPFIIDLKDESVAVIGKVVWFGRQIERF